MYVFINVICLPSNNNNGDPILRGKRMCERREERGSHWGGKPVLPISVFRKLLSSNSVSMPSCDEGEEEA